MSSSSYAQTAISHGIDPAAILLATVILGKPCTDALATALLAAANAGTGSNALATALLAAANAGTGSNAQAIAAAYRAAQG